MKKILFPFLFMIILFPFSGFAKDGSVINSERIVALKVDQNAITKVVKLIKHTNKTLSSVVKLENEKIANENFLLYCREVEVNTICGIAWTGNVCTPNAVLTTAEFHIVANWADIFACGDSYWIVI